MFHCCLEVINRRGLDPSNLVFDPPPQEKDSEVAIRGMQRPRDSWQSQNDSYSFDFYSFDSYSFEQWVVAPSCCQTLTWPVTDELLPARPDCEQIIKGIGDINADLPTSSIIHFTTSPFPSMTQTNSCHHRAIPPSQTCLLVFRILWHPREVISFILGMGEGDTISHHSQEVVQGIFACKWWQF